ncbi:MAG: Eco57I restriction-modification methylase domain-containing protein [Thermoflavifilum sp.]|nr:Eco57I restriction-modification methylase domain-containing protein [Thermoflavifilum sp.]
MNAKKRLELLIQNPIEENIINFFQEKNTNFTNKREPIENCLPNFTNGKLLSDWQMDDVSRFVVCSFQVKQNLTERSGKKDQYQQGKEILKNYLADAGIFIFYDPEKNFRFSLIYTDYLGKKRDWSSFKRFTYYVSKYQTNKTFLQQVGEADFSTLDKIKEAFSVVPVTKQFYNEIQTWYFWAMDKIKFPEDYKYSSDPAKDKEIRNATNLIRLITRIIFIWFLKEKKLVPSNLFSPDYLKDIIQDFNKNQSSRNYYNAILQNLFFATLNQKMNERKFAKDEGYPANKEEYGVKNLFRYKEKFLIQDEEDILDIFKDIPFLNGGLFDCLDKTDETGKVVYIDGFSRNPQKQAIIPDYLFFSKSEERIDLSNLGLGTKPVRGLFEILNQYNFTVDENTPVDEEVALDPELLGKVFENLLAAYNPETSTTARKATGSYYTPREIVEYMVNESLVAYFKTALQNNTSEFENNIRELLNYNAESNPFENDPTTKQQLIQFIAHIKILDPACGSGAFPMGILHKLVHILQQLDPKNEYWQRLQERKIKKEINQILDAHDKEEQKKLWDEFKDAFDESINYPDYARKLYLIENCIYGVDIQPIAIQISKLRFFISLILEQKIDRNKENFGIRALPNLETKFVSANTLIGLEKPQQLSIRNPDIEKKEEELKQIRHKYFTANTRKKKLEYQRRDKELREELVNLLINDNWGKDVAEKIAKFDLYDQNASADWFDPEWMFGVTDGFDIVIGNPPYIQLQNDGGKLAKLYANQKFQTFARTGDIYTLFYEKGLQLLKDKGILAFITSNKWMRAGYGEKTREFFLKYNPLMLIDLGPGVFENATVDTNILIIQKAPNQNHLKAITYNDKKLSIEETVNSQSVILEKLTKNAWFIGSSAEQQLKEKIERIGKPLKDWDVNIYYGIKTGLNEAFIINTEKRNEILANCKTEEERIRTEKIIKPILRGRDIKRYYYEWAELWVIGTFPALRLNIDDYPAIKKYFLDNFDIRQLEQSGKKYPELGFDARKKTGNKWFETQDQIAYYPEFEKEKVVWSETIKIYSYGPKNYPRFSYTTKDFYLDKTTFFLSGKNQKYFLALLNSKIGEFLLENGYCVKLGTGSRGLQKILIEKIPLPPITASNQGIVSQIESLVDKILSAKKQNPQADTQELEQEIDRLVYKLYDLTEEEIKIIEEEK